MSEPSVPMFFQLRAGWQAASETALFNGVTYVLDDMRRPCGVMAGLLGPRYAVDDLFDGDLDGEEPDLLGLVRAYPVPALMDATVGADGEADIAARLEDFFADHCPEFEWRVDRDLRGPLK